MRTETYASAAHTARRNSAKANSVANVMEYDNFPKRLIAPIREYALKKARQAKKFSQKQGVKQ